MKERVQGCITAGVALAGAGVIAAMPVAQGAPEALTSTAADVALTASSASPVDAALRVGQGLGESGVRLATSSATAPLGLLAIAAAIAGNDNEALYNAVEAYIDGPNYVVDPILFAVDDVLPAPIGGDPSTDPRDMYASAVSRFRADVLLGARDDVREAVADALGVGELPDVNDEGAIYAAARLGAGFAVSGVRAAQSAALAPVGLVAVAQGLQQSFETGDNTALYVALRQYIDAPNYVTDPVVFAVDDVLPQPVGSDPQTDPTKMNGSEVSRFRATALLGVRDQVRGAVAGALDVDPNVVVATNAQTAKNGAGARSLSPGTSAGSATKTGNSSVATKTNSPRPVRAVVKAINDQVKASTDRLERTVKKLTGGEQKKSDTGSEG